MSFDSLSPSDRKAVREELDRLLESEQFQQSRRRQRFLEYIVTETLDGRGDRLKGYTIAREVFDRPEEFDPNTDPIVRMEAARLRDRLREYYEGDGRDDPVRIELQKGTYTPQIAFATVVDRPPKNRDRVVAGVTRREPLRLRSWGQWRIVASAAALVTLLAVAAVWFATSELRQPRNVLEGEQSLSDVPAVAVLPFTNLSGDPKQDYFSDGITEDILTELSRARNLRVLARNTTFQYKGKAVNVGELGRELAVSYVTASASRPNSLIRRRALISGRIGTTAISLMSFSSKTRS
jgi:adenylate cyclase